jgi:hypothetical protein
VQNVVFRETADVGQLGRIVDVQAAATAHAARIPHDEGNAGLSNEQSTITLTKR